MKISRIRSLFSQPRWKFGFHLLLIFLSVMANLFIQAFCVPSLWAMLTLLVVFIYLASKPLIDKYSGSTLFGVWDGLSLMTMLYCILFLWPVIDLVVLSIFMGVGLLGFMPYYFVFTILKPYFFQLPKRRSAAFLITIAFLTGTCVMVATHYRQTALQIKNAIEEEQSYPTSFMAEKITGMHFKYHTQANLYDGWRPPLHEPILVLGYQLNGRWDPCPRDLKKRIGLYRENFSDKPVKLDCSCAEDGRGSYHSDKLWEE